MPGFDEYKQIKKNQNMNPDDNLINNDSTQLDQYYQNKRAHNLVPDLDENGHAVVKFDYDADQLLEKFEKRSKNDDDFKERTEYYFTDSRIAAAKVERYRSIGAGEQGTVDAYQRHYKYNFARKRKSHATTASTEFATMQNLMEEYSQRKGLMGAVEQYNYKERIMNHRINGMVAAAYTKAKSKNHMKYLENKAKLSCYTALKDQLEHAISDLEQKGPRYANALAELRGKQGELDRNINNAYKNLKKYTPKSQDVWREKKGMNSRFYTRKKAEYSGRTALVTTEQTKLLSNLEAIQQENGENEWPLSVVLTDQVNAPMNKGESDIRTRNQLYRTTKEDATVGEGEAKEVAKAKLKEMDMEALKRFNSIHVPTLAELGNPYKYVMNNLRDYYELFKKGLPYYNRTGVPSYVKNYMNTHQEFMVKLRYLAAADSYIDYVLRSKYMVEYNRDGVQGHTKPGRFIIESHDDFKYHATEDGGWHREKKYGDGEERSRYVKLEQAFEKYERDNKSISEGRILPKDYDLEHGVGDKNVIAKGKKVKNEPKKDLKKNIILDEEDNNLINSNIIKIKDDEDLNIISTTGKKTDKIIEIEKEDKKEEKKEEKKENLNKINIIEESSDNIILENSNNNIIIESKGELSQVHIKDELFGIDTEGLTKEEEAEYQKLSAKAVPEFTRQSYLVRKKILHSMEVSEDPELVAQVKNAEKLHRFEMSSDGTITRAPGSILRQVHYNEKGEPISKQDKENHKWNKKWITAWEEGDYETRETMIEEEFPKFMESIKKYKIPVPPKDVKPGDTKWLDEYFENVIKADLDGFIDVMVRRSVGISNLIHDHKSVQRYLDAHPEEKEMLNAYTYIGVEFGNFTQGKYGFSADDGKVTAKRIKKTNLAEEVRTQQYEPVATILSQSVGVFREQYPDSEYLVGNKEQKNKIKENFFEEQPKVNEDLLTSEEVPASLEDAYKNLDDLYKGVKLTDKEKEFNRKVTREGYYYSKETIGSIPKSLYLELYAKKPAGIDPRGFVTMLQPVKRDKYGRPLNDTEEKKLQQNIKDVRSLMSNKLSDRKPFLDRVALEAKRIMYTTEELSNHELLRKDMQRSLRNLNLLHNLLNLYKYHSDYYQTKADPEISASIFMMCGGTEYVTHAIQQIQYALYGENGLERAYSGESSSMQFYVNYKAGNDLQELKELNQKLNKMDVLNSKNYASIFYMAYKNNEDPYEEYPEHLEAFKNKKFTSKDLQLTGENVYDKEYGKKSTFSFDNEIKIMKNYIDPLAGRVLTEKGEDAVVKGLEFIKHYRGSVKKVDKSNANGVIDDLPKPKNREIKRKKKSK